MSLGAPLYRTNNIPRAMDIQQNPGTNLVIPDYILPALCRSKLFILQGKIMTFLSISNFDILLEKQVKSIKLR